MLNAHPQQAKMQRESKKWIGGPNDFANSTVTKQTTSGLGFFVGEGGIYTNCLSLRECFDFDFFLFFFFFFG